MAIENVIFARIKILICILHTCFGYVRTGSNYSLWVLRGKPSCDQCSSVWHVTHTVLHMLRPRGAPVSRLSSHLLLPGAWRPAPRRLLLPPHCAGLCRCGPLRGGQQGHRSGRAGVCWDGAVREGLKNYSSIDYWNFPLGGVPVVH